MCCAKPQISDSVTTHSESETLEYGRKLANSLEIGDVVCISGQLGAGKTVLCRGIAIGLGVDPEHVSSPSFSIINEYRGRVELLHADFYRLSGAEEVERIGWSDYLERDAVLLIEWPEIARAALPAKRIEITIESASTSADEQSRNISLRHVNETSDSND
jgi:tRNA threonylcarbamoyladenosine biosynthesis protein TsaE